MMVLPIISIVVVLVLIYATLTYSLLIPAKKGLPILMYHKISETKKDGLTIQLNTLEQQFNYLKAKGYQTLSFADVSESLKSGLPLPKRSVVLTFDDAYQNNYEFLLPLLSRLNMKASIFLPLAYLGKTNIWDKGSDALMSVETVKQIASMPNLEFGIHSFDHQNYKHLSAQEIENDLKQCDAFILQHNLKIQKVFAYPYGGTPRKKPALNEQMKELLKKYAYSFGLRIGNSINTSLVASPYELCRIDIKGTDRFFEFKIKLKKGRTKLF